MDRRTISGALALCTCSLPPPFGDFDAGTVHFLSTTLRVDLAMANIPPPNFYELVFPVPLNRLNHKRFHVNFFFRTLYSEIL